MQKKVVLAALAALVSYAHADIVGFNNLAGWKYNQVDNGTPADMPSPDLLHFTTGYGQKRSVFYSTPQDITQFTAQFTYRVSDTSSSELLGLTFCLQNDARHEAAVGSYLGYTTMGPSAAIAIFSDNNDSWNGFWTGGTAGGGNQNVDPVNVYAFRDILVEVTYANPILVVTLDDPTIGAGADFSRNYIVGDLSTTVGKSTAYVGFTAGTDFGVSQYISNFSYVVPSPGVAAVLMSGGALGVLRRRRA